MTPEEKKEQKRLYDIDYNKRNAEKKKEQAKKWLEKNNEIKKAKSKLYTEKTKEQKRLYDIEYRKKIKDLKKENDKQYYKDNKDVIKERVKIYSINNKNSINKRIAIKKETDPLYKLSCNMRSSIRQSFIRKGLQKLSKTEIILGCSFVEFKQYIESLFEDWMNWNNQGNPKDGVYEINKTWDVDHIIPLSTGVDEKDIIRLNHYTNLQPLCSYTNRFIKSNR